MSRTVASGLLVLAFVSCVVGEEWGWTRLNPHMVANGTHITRNATHISFSDPSGHTETFAATRTTPAFTHATETATASGWVSSLWSWGNSYTYFSGVWTVPHPPTMNSGQIIFFFNSLEGGTGGSSGSDILQPVLQYNNGVGGWTLASWYGDSAGYVEATPVAVHPGDVIKGVISLSSDNVWSVLSYVNEVLKSNLTVSVDALGVGQNTAQWALEVYNMEMCDYYPPTDFLTLRDVHLQDEDVTVPPNWDLPSINTGACDIGGYVTDHLPTITWNSAVDVEFKA